MQLRTVRARHPRWSSFGLVLGLLFSLILAPIGRLSAHSNHDHVVYVAPVGRDEGACDQPWLPCRSIRYAIRQANGQGGEVRVAAGDYFFEASNVLLLVGEQIRVTGGFSLRDSFSRADPLANPTFVSGIPSRYRDRLAARGFGRVEDREGREEAGDVVPGVAEPLLPHEIASPSAQQPCVEGKAGIFACAGIDYLSSVPLSAFGASAGSNLWGHVDLNTGREYAIIGLNTGTGVVDVTTPDSPVIIGTVPGVTSSWREVKVYQFFNNGQQRWNAYAYLSTEGSQGLQIIDLNKLGAATPQVSLAATMGTDFTRSHTVYIKNVDYSTNVALPGQTPVLYMNGTRQGSTRLATGIFRAFNISNPVAPTLIGVPAADRSYTHDNTTMVITDTRTTQCVNGHNPCEVMVDFSEDEINLWDVTDSANAKLLGSAVYATGSPSDYYAHSGWYTEDKQHLFIQDEFDELSFGHNSRVRTLDISDLTDPVISATWDGPTAAIDHNGYTIGDKYYMSNYRRGLTILDISNPNAISELGFFDTYLADNDAEFNGAWGVYPFLPSGTLLISDIERGLVIVRESDNTTVVRAVAGLGLATTSPTMLPATTAFTASLASGTDVTYTWDFGDGTALQATTTPTTSHAYAAAGSYVAKVTAANSANSITTQKTVTVNQLDTTLAGLTLAASTPTYLPAATIFTATLSSGSNAEYTWDFGDGSPAVITTSLTVQHTYLAPGVYPAKVTAANSINSLDATVSVDVRRVNWLWLPLIQRVLQK